MKRLLLTVFGVFLTLSLFSQDPQLVMQGWYWDYPKTAQGAQWTDTLSMKAEELAHAGFTHIWFPPHTAASFGTGSNGYDPKDLFIGNQTTGLGTRPSLDNMVQTFTDNGIRPVADLIYNHRDGGDWEDNPAVTGYIFDPGIGTAHTIDPGSPYPNDRYRLTLPLGGTSGNEAGDYYFKFSSKSGGFGGVNYKIYTWTNTVTGFNGSINESEPNGGGDCGEASNDLPLITDFFGEIDNTGCTIDEIKITINPGDYDPAGDTLYIQVSADGEGYHDFRPFGVWNASASQDVVGQIMAQTATDFTNMPSGLGGMNYNAFRPNDNNYTTERLRGEWNTMLFFYDYDQSQTQTIDVLNEWTEWNWDELQMRGIRMDAIKHFDPSYVSNMLNYMVSQGKVPDYVVGEWFDTNLGAQQNWLNQVIGGLTPAAQSAVQPKVFDFSLREALRSACDEFGYDARNVFNNSLNAFGVSGFNVSTFVNNHDFRELGNGGKSLVENDPILAYAYILTNNQIGVPTVFYPDYYGQPDLSWHPNSVPPLKDEIDDLWTVHKEYINGADNITYLNSSDAGNTFDDNANYISGATENSLIYQIGNTSLGKSIVVAINFSGQSLQVDHQINTFSGAIPQGEIFTDVLRNSAFTEAVVDSQNRIFINLPPRSYSVWVQGEVCPIENYTSTDAGDYPSSYECIKDEWTNYFQDVNGNQELLFAIEKGTSGIEVSPSDVSVGINAGSGAVDLSAAPYVSTNGWWVARRFWDVNVTTQPNQPVKVRFYFTQEDIDDLASSPALYTGLDDLVFYKISNHDPDPSTGHAGVMSSDFTEITSPDVTIVQDGDTYYAEFEVDSFSGGGVGLNGGPLPIELLSFDVVVSNESDASLTWSTAAEQNNKHFIVERSIDSGASFQTVGAPIASLAPEGNSDVQLDYSFVDKDAAAWAEQVHYRVKQVDYDGQFSYTPIRLVDFSGAEISKTKLFPNPVRSGQPVVIHAKEINRIEVFSARGELVEVFEELNEQRSTSIDTADLAPGVYLVVINGKDTMKLIVQ